jgi:hypothetical protein
MPNEDVDTTIPCTIQNIHIVCQYRITTIYGVLGLHIQNCAVAIQLRGGFADPGQTSGRNNPWKFNTWIGEKWSQTT